MHQKDGTIGDMDNQKKYSVDADYLYPKESWLIPKLTSHDIIWSNEEKLEHVPEKELFLQCNIQNEK